MLFEPHPTSHNGEEESLSEGAFDLPYRMVFALATVEAVIIYDTAGDVCVFTLSDTPWHEPSLPKTETACHGVLGTLNSCCLPFEDSHYSEPVQPPWLSAHCPCMTQPSGTAGLQPLAVLGGLHFEAAPITDIAWSCDGRYLAMSSYDGERALCNSSCNSSLG